MKASAKSPFVGRENEKRELLEALDQAKAGRGSLILIAGQPGIGKSRLAEEAVSAAISRGFEVATGACWEAGGASAYWPWTQIVRHCAERKPGKMAKFRGQDALSDGATLAGAVKGDFLRASEDVPRDALQGGGDQFTFFDSFAEAIRDFAASAGLLIVLEDLHAADTDSVLLAQFLARQIGHSPIVMIGTYREREAQGNRGLEALILQLARTGRTIRLRGLGSDEIRELVRQYGKFSLEEKAIEELRHTTEGNPFFLNEILVSLRTTGETLGLRDGSGMFALPDSARIAIESRLSCLPPEAVEILRVASVFGREFDASSLSSLCKTDRDTILSNLDIAERWAIISRFGGSSGRYRFDHFLLTEVLYGQLSTGQRESLHLMIAEMLESQRGGAASEAQLAHHYFRSLPASAEKALRYSLQSGDLAMRSFAYAEAARLYQMALTALEVSSSPNQPQACELLLRLGRAQCRSHEFDKFKQTFLQAATLAREVGNPEFLAQAALGYGMAGKKDFDAQDIVTAGLLREALEAGASLSSGVRSLLFSRLAEELRWSTEQDSLLQITDEAVAMARRSGDPHSLMQALHIRFQCLRGWPERVAEKLDLTAEMVAVAERSNLHEWLFRARYHRASTQLEFGKRDYYAEVKAIRQIPEAMRLFTQGLSFAEVSDVLSVTIALMEGRFEESERLLNQGFARGSERPDFAAAYFAGFFGLQIILLRREQGRTAELEQPLRQAASEPSNFVARAALAHFHAESGKFAEAAGDFDILAANGFEGLIRDFSWPISVAYLVETCGAIHDAARARVLFDLVKPCSGRHAVLGMVVYLGAFDYYLGLLAAVFGDTDASKEHFLAALEAHKTFNARPWIARTQFHYARLLASGSDEERVTSASLLSSALAAAESMDMPKLASDCRAALNSPEGRKNDAGAQPAPSLKRNCSIRKENDYWRLIFEDSSSTLRDRKGFTYLTHLLRNPGNEFASVQLASAKLNADGTLSVIAQASRADNGLEIVASLGDAGEILDAQARAEYKHRIDELRSEIDEAERFNDLGRLEKLQPELEALEDHIRGAVGLGGRSRRASSHGERARVKITVSIKSAIDAIEIASPKIGGYLKKTIKTGTFCSYSPDLNVSIDWSF